MPLLSVMPVAWLKVSEVAAKPSRMSLSPLVKPVMVWPAASTDIPPSSVPEVALAKLNVSKPVNWLPSDRPTAVLPPRMMVPLPLPVCSTLPSNSAPDSMVRARLPVARIAWVLPIMVPLSVMPPVPPKVIPVPEMSPLLIS